MIQGYIQGMGGSGKSRLEINAKLDGNLLAATVNNISGNRQNINHSTVVCGDYIYVFGGYNAGGIATVRRLDTTTGEWSSLKNLPSSGGSNLGAVLCGDVIYVASYSNYFYAYNIETNTYEQKANIPASVNNVSGMFAYNGKVYLLHYQNTTSAPLYCYDPVMNSWTTKAVIPNPRQLTVCEMVDNKVYVLGGNKQAGALPANNVYYPATDVWTFEPLNTDIPFENATSWVENDTIYVLYNGDKLMSYITTLDKWVYYQSPFPVYANYAPGAKIVGDYLYIIGGVNASGGVIATTHKLFRPSVHIELSDSASFEFDKDVFLNNTRRTANTLHNINTVEGDVLKITEPETTGYIEYNGTIKTKS